MTSVDSGACERASVKTVTFRSILFGDAGTPEEIDTVTPPDCFSDLNLDQIAAALTAGRDEYNLKPFFFYPLTDLYTVNYRYDVQKDLENETIRGHIQAFAQKMQAMRGGLAQSAKMHYKLQRQRWFLDAVDHYCSAVLALRDDLASAGPNSRGLRDFRDYLTGYTDTAGFVALVADTQRLKDQLASIRYSLRIAGKRIYVSKYGGESNYSAEVLQVFEKFKQAEANEYRFNLRVPLEMNHVEAGILDLVALLFPEVFDFLEKYSLDHAGFLDPVIAKFDREIQFYVACLEYVSRFKAAGLPFCYPDVSSKSKQVKCDEAFDLALANRLLGEGAAVVTNDFYLRDPERILVVSGPNSGGKTTFARTFGQLHYLASIGCPVPARKAALFLCDRLFTHFEREEDLQNLSGKLEDELRRIRQILERATPMSILIMNESFLSTTLDDASYLSRQVMERIIVKDMICVSVTFLDELASLGETTVSMVSTVAPHDPASRTFKIIRRPADGLAYAAAIAEKHGLTYEGISRRLQQTTSESTVS